MAKSRFQWEKSLDGFWSRDIDECELFYRSCSRKDNNCYPVTACASFIINAETSKSNENDSQIEQHVEDAFHKAWMNLNYNHPSLRSLVQHVEDSGQPKRVYSTFQDKNDEKRWLNETFHVVNVDVDLTQWFNMNSPTFEISTVFLVRSRQGDTSDCSVFLRCPHDITDGIGVLQLLDQLFTEAALSYTQGSKYTLPEWGNEHLNLSPCLRVAAAIPETFSESDISRFEDIQAQNRTAYNHPSFLSLPPSSKTATLTHGTRQRLPLLIPREVTAQILQNSKAIAPGVNVTHVFMSALAIALAELQPRQEEPYPVRYANHSMMNLRPYCRDPYPGPAHAAAAYHTISAQALSIDLIVSGTDNVDQGEANQLPQIATSVRGFYHTARPTSSSSSDQVVHSPLTFQAFTPPSGTDPHLVSEPSCCPVALSSIGNVSSIVDAHHGPFQLTRVWAASEPIGAGVAVFLGTWDGRIELSGVFDTRYHDGGYIEGFLERIVKCVCRGLGIGELPARE